MIVKAEQERIRALLRDTITLLCRNGLTFKSEFSIEALIGITLDKDDVVLVSINEQVRPDRSYHGDGGDASSEEEGMNWSKHSYDDLSPRYKNHHQHRRRRRKRPHIKTEADAVTDDEGLLDLSTDHAATATPHDQPPPIKRSHSQDATPPPPGDSDEDNKSSVVVKKEYTDDSWPPAGVVQEVTVGGSDSGQSDQHAYYTPPATSSSLQQSLAGLSSLVSPGSSPRTLPHLPPAMMNGIPFPPLPLPQSHFAQALGRLVGSIPPNLSQKMSHNKESTSHTPSRASHGGGGGTPLYQPSTRSSLPKEAVALMTEWLRKNMHNPYPTDDIKDDFVQKTGLTFNQINYWFTNARRRLLPKWELQRSIQEQEMVHQMAAQQQHMSGNNGSGDSGGQGPAQSQA